MTVKQWSPWQDLEHIQHQLSDVLRDVTHNGVEGRDGQWSPRVDIRETDDALLLEAELPGVKKEDVTLEVKDGVLALTGERRYEKEVDDEQIHRIERVYGRFSRSFSLPRNVNTEQVEAQMDDGMLRVRLSKLESAKPKTIAIA